MKLSDIMGNAGLAFYAEVALVLFVVVFVLQAVRIWAPSRRALMDAAGRMPLDDPNDLLAARAAARGGRRPE